MLREAFYHRALNLNVLLDDPSYFFTGRSLLKRAFLRIAVPALGMFTRIYKNESIRLLEKTPKNSLRVSFLNRLFPKALFIWNKRGPKKNIDSLIAGWRTTDRLGPLESPRFATYDVAGELDLQDYEGTAWKFALVPGWRSLRGGCVADVAAWQYFQCNHYAMKDFQVIEEDRIFEVKHERFVDDPLPIVHDILKWADLPQAKAVDRFAKALPRVNDTREDDERNHGKSLRCPNEVRRVVNGLSELEGLCENMGYSLSPRNRG